MLLNGIGVKIYYYKITNNDSPAVKKFRFQFARSWEVGKLYFETDILFRWDFWKPRLVMEGFRIG